MADHPIYAALYDRKIIIERGILGREFECAVMGNRYPVAAVPCEILPSVGNIRRQPIKDILASSAMKDSVAGIKRKDCHCTHDCNMQENILFNPKQVPALLASRG